MSFRTQKLLVSMLPSLHTSTSYGDFEGNTSTTSGSSFMRGDRTTHSAPPTELDRKKKTRGRDDETRTSSGYNSYSELSEFARSSEKRKSASLKSNRYSSSNDADHDDRYTRFPNKHKSMDTLENKHNRSSAKHKHTESRMSICSSEPSQNSSKERSLKRNTDKNSNSDNYFSDGKSVPTIGNVAVTVTNNVNYDPNDPFSFIQPVDVPFLLKLRKCAGPISAVLLLLILAAALGAAIYFASALKDLLGANLAMKIKHIENIENIEDLSKSQLTDLSHGYCKQAIAIVENSYINFTLFFVEKDATSSQIMGVIEKSADKKTEESIELAVVDKFELELGSLEIHMERQKPSTPSHPAETPSPTAKANPAAVPVGTTPQNTRKIKPQPADLRGLEVFLLIPGVGGIFADPWGWRYFCRFLGLEVYVGSGVSRARKGASQTHTNNDNNNNHDDNNNNNEKTDNNNR
ncbi:hypothetical protein MAR_013375 [Mya arenaria]|uniref:Uncharacterized protein n=1 Tax=Mya arenaria TaxID=6604 RepID=A0ABY7G8U8_MYAAR|nr:hypothetical protein MAR_013375 [Mya arenaria]